MNATPMKLRTASGVIIAALFSFADFYKGGLAGDKKTKSIVGAVFGAFIGWVARQRLRFEKIAVAPIGSDCPN